MFSLSKLVVLIAAVAAVWYGFKYVTRLQLERERKAEARDRVERRREARARGTEPSAEDMVQCPACKAYVPAKGARNCGRPDCPY
jgi:uncharacterized protein